MRGAGSAVFDKVSNPSLNMVKLQISSYTMKYIVTSDIVNELLTLRYKRSADRLESKVKGSSHEPVCPWLTYACNADMA